MSIPPHLRSIADLRDRGYFKKMQPSRKTRFIGQSHFSIDTPNHLESGMFDTIPPPLGVPLPVPTDTLSPVLAAATLPNVPPSHAFSTNHINRVPTTGISGTPRHINGIPVVQNPHSRVNTFYSNTPVGGSFRIPAQRGLSPIPAQNRTLANTIRMSERQLTPSHRRVNPIIN